jgi:Sec-independent protein translocase protein TatA
MDSFLGFGFWEIALVLLIILAVMGPRRLPEIAQRMGTLYRKLKMASRDLTSELTKEVEGTPLDKKQVSADILNPLKEAASDLKSSFTKSLDDTPPTNEETPKDNKESKAPE